MKTRLYNARILDLRNDCAVFLGEVVVENEIIIYVSELPYQDNCDVNIDCHKNLVMPGFKNAHTHSGMTFLRSYADDLSLHSWLFEKVFPLEAKLQGEDLYWLSKLAILEYLSSGITSNMDMYLFPRIVAKASIDMNYRTVLLGCLTDDGEDIESMDNLYNEMNNISSLVTYKLGFHSEYTISESILKNVSILAHKHSQPVFTHLSETEEEVKNCLNKRGMTPLEYFDSLGLLDFGGGMYHCVHMSEHDLEIMKKHNVTAVTCPGSNTKLASGIADIRKMVDRGINVAIGTDGTASNNSLDFFKEMYLTAGLQKLLHKDAACLDANKVIEFATLGGARVMGLSKCEYIEKNQLADLTVIDLHQPNMQPINNIVKNIVYSGAKSNVWLTMVNGKILYQNGEFFINDDIDNIYNHCQEITDRLKAK